MNSRTKYDRHMALVCIIAAISLTILLSVYFGLPDSLTVPLIVVLSLLCGALALWVNANRHVDGSEWWQDDDTAGWRG